MSLTAAAAKPVYSVRLPQSRTVRLFDRPLTISRVIVEGPFRPSPTALAEVFTPNQLLGVGVGLLVRGEAIPFEVRRIESGEVPVIAPRGLERTEITGGKYSWGVMYNTDGRRGQVIYLSLSVPDYFGLTQDSSRAALESGLEIVEMRASDDVYSRTAHEILAVRMKAEDPRNPLQALEDFRSKLTTRMQKRDEVGELSEGKGLYLTYQELISAAAKFAETFPADLVGLTKEEIEKAFQAHPAVAAGLLKYLRVRFDKIFASHYGLGEDHLASLKKGIENNISKCRDKKTREALEFLLNFAVAIEETNAFDYNRDLEMCVFRLSSHQLKKLTDKLRISLPSDLVYVYSVESESFALSARYGGKVTKGGDRYYGPKGHKIKEWTPKEYERVKRASLGEVLRLAWTQKRKNAIWACFVNGLKTVLVRAPIAREARTAERLKETLAQFQTKKVYLRIRDALRELEVDIDAEVNALLAQKNASAETLYACLVKLWQLEDLVRLSDGEVYLKTLGDKYPGPDVRMSNLHLEFLTVLAHQAGVPAAEAVYTGKSKRLGGFPHRDWMVTGRGVFTNLKIAQQKLGIAETASVTIQGFGDVGGALVNLILTESKLKLTAVADENGILECEAGLGSNTAVKRELLRLQREGKSLAEFKPRLLKGGVRYRKKEEFRSDEAFNDAIVTRKADVFIPAALGDVIKRRNVGRVLANKTLVVEGANIPFEPGADVIFDSRGGKRINDLFANGGGVKTSEGEILAILTLGVDGVKEVYKELHADNDRLLQRVAEENSVYFWEQYFKQNRMVPFPEITLRSADAVTLAKNIILVSETIFDQQKVFNVLFDALFPTIHKWVKRDEVIERLGRTNVKEKIATELARRIVLAHDLGWLERIKPTKRDEAVIAEAERIINQQG